MKNLILLLAMCGKSPTQFKLLIDKGASSKCGKMNTEYSASFVDKELTQVLTPKS
jgi:hypothetical protein